MNNLDISGVELSRIVYIYDLIVVFYLHYC